MPATRRRSHLEHGGVEVGPPRILMLIGATLGGAVGWWIGAWVGDGTAFFVSVVGTAAGTYAGGRFARRYLQ